MQVSIYLQNWSHVLSYVSKAESTPEIAEVSKFIRALYSYLPYLPLNYANKALDLIIMHLVLPISNFGIAAFCFEQIADMSYSCIYTWTVLDFAQKLLY